MKISALAAAGMTAFVLGGCAGSSDSQPPAWFAERVAEEQGDYPSLREVPRTSIANIDQAHWAEAERQMMQAAAELRSNPRAQPGQPVDPAAFLQEARGALDATRRSHEPAASATPAPTAPPAEPQLQTPPPEQPAPTPPAAGQ